MIPQTKKLFLGSFFKTGQMTWFFANISMNLLLSSSSDCVENTLQSRYFRLDATKPYPKFGECSDQLEKPNKYLKYLVGKNNQIAIAKDKWPSSNRNIFTDSKLFANSRAPVGSNVAYYESYKPCPEHRQELPSAATVQPPSCCRTWQLDGAG